MTNKKQKKVLHARVSEELFDKISTKAKKHRISTSNLIRNLVEDYLEIHEDVWEAVDGRLRRYVAEGKDSVIGYQPIKLSKNTVCALCEKKLKADSQAFVGFFEKSSQKLIVCEDCSKSEADKSTKS